jgi:hypothetical protein
MAGSPVTPVSALAAKIATAGVAVTPFPPNIGGGFIQNPLSALDQNVTPTEPLYVDPTGGTPGSAPGAGWGSTFVIYPGQTWAAIPFQSTPTKVNGATGGHQYSAVYWYPGA